MIYRFGDYRLDTLRHELTHQGSLVALEPKSYRMLAYFVTNAGRVIAKEELLKHVWPSVNVDETAVRRCIRNIRKALDEERFEQKIIETRHGQGYLFLPKVTISESPTANAAPPPSLSEQAEETTQDFGASLLQTAMLLSQSHNPVLGKRQNSPEPNLIRPEVFFNTGFGVALALRNHPDHAQAP